MRNAKANRKGTCKTTAPADAASGRSGGRQNRRVPIAGLSLFQAKAVRIIENIHGRESAEELAGKYHADNAAAEAEAALGEEYDREEIVPIPAKCPRCKRAFIGRDAISAPSLDNVCCFYCGPNRSTRLIPHPSHPVIDAKTRRHGLFSSPPPLAEGEPSPARNGAEGGREA